MVACGATVTIIPLFLFNETFWTWIWKVDWIVQFDRRRPYKVRIGRGQKINQHLPFSCSFELGLPQKLSSISLSLPHPRSFPNQLVRVFYPPKQLMDRRPRRFEKIFKKAKAFPGIAVRGNACRAKSTKFVSTRQLVHCLFRKSPFLSPFYPSHSKLCTKLPLHPLNYKTGPIKLRRGGREGGITREKRLESDLFFFLPNPGCTHSQKLH